MYYSKNIIDALQFIQDKAFCFRNGYKACKKFNEIQDQLILEDKCAIYDELSELYSNPDTFWYSNNREFNCKDLAEKIKKIKNRKLATENLFNNFHLYKDWTDKYGFYIRIDPCFTDGTIANKIKERNELNGQSN